MKYLILFLCGFLFFCSRGHFTQVKPDKKQPVQKLTRTACLPEITVALEDTLIIEFTEYPGRAFAWELRNSENTLSGLKLLGVKRISMGDADDSAEKAEYSFIAVSKGSDMLRFLYQRPWEKNKPAADSCLSKVFVK